MHVFNYLERETIKTMAHKSKTWRRRGSHLYLRKERARQREQKIKRHAPGMVEKQQEGHCGWRALSEEELFRQGVVGSLRVLSTSILREEEPLKSSE